MGEDTNIFPRLKALYKKLSAFPIIAQVLKKIFEFGVKVWAFYAGISFPAKFTWQWKVEMLSGRYEKNTVDLFKTILKPGMTVLDIGAHIGYYTLLFSKLVGPTGKVIAFEAEKDNFSLLQKNTKHLKNVRVYNMAISDRDGFIDFYTIAGSTGCHSIVPTDSSAEKTSVSSITIDTLAKRDQLKIDAIKIDIEGAEPLAFAGMKQLLSQPGKMFIISELNPDALVSSGATTENFLKMIADFGFAIYTILPGGLKQKINTSDTGHINFYKAKKEYTNLLFEK